MGNEGHDVVPLNHVDMILQWREEIPDFSTRRLANEFHLSQSLSLEDNS